VFLIFSGLLAAQSNDLLTHIWQGRGRVLVEGERVASGVVSVLMAKRTRERPAGDPKI
jgi:hypothetical protein